MGKRTRFTLSIGTSLAAVVLLVVATPGCRKEPTRWDKAVEAPLPPKPAEPSQQEKAGGSFNRAFPSDGVSGYQRVFTQEQVTVADNRLDHVAAVLDMATNYFEHTSIQSVARRVISRAYGEL
jgi:hypothetical protein